MNLYTLFLILLYVFHGHATKSERLTEFFKSCELVSYGLWRAKKWDSGVGSNAKCSAPTSTLCGPRPLSC